MTAPNEIDFFADIIDSRDIIARHEYLMEKSQEAAENDEVLDADEQRELEVMEEVMEEGAQIEDWQHGATLIAEDYFETYAEQLASDIGAISSDAGWPLQHINWTAAANALKMDYAEIEIAGNMFLVR